MMPEASKGKKKCPRDPAQLAKFVVDVATGEIEDRELTPEEQGKTRLRSALVSAAA
jgi:hypothetical protein